MADDGDAPLPSSPPDLDSTQHLPGPSIAVDPQEQAWQRLITRAVPSGELPSLIETIFSGRKSNVVGRLRESDARAFINIMDEVRHHARSLPVIVNLLPFYVLLFRH